MINDCSLLFDYRPCSVTGFLCLIDRNWRFYRYKSKLITLSWSLKHDFYLMVTHRPRHLLTIAREFNIQIPIALVFKL